jgi:hypothetical protein
MLRIHASSAPANSCQQTAQQIPSEVPRIPAISSASESQRSRARNPCHQFSPVNPCQPRTSEFLPAAQHCEFLRAAQQGISASSAAEQDLRQRYLPGAQPSDSLPARTRSFLRGSQEFTRLRASEELGAGMLTGKRIKDQRARAGRRLPSESRQTTLYVACGAGTPSQLQSHLRRLCHGNAHSPAATVWGRRLWILHSRTVAFGGLLLTGRQRVRAT